MIVVVNTPLLANVEVIEKTSVMVTVESVPALVLIVESKLSEDRNSQFPTSDKLLLLLEVVELSQDARAKTKVSRMLKSTPTSGPIFSVEENLRGLA
jgi:hypothetical protein